MDNNMTIRELQMFLAQKTDFEFRNGYEGEYTKAFEKLFEILDFLGIEK